MTQRFPNLIMSHRKAMGLAQSEVADYLLMARSTYNHYEKGTRAPSIDAIIRISALYKLNPLDLICSMIPKDLEEKYPDYIDWVYSGKYALKTKDIQMLHLYHTLKEKDQVSINQMMRSILSSYKS